MNLILPRALSQFLRYRYDVFTIDDVIDYFQNIGLKAKSEEIESCLHMCSYVLELKGGAYISKSGLFTDAIFSIKPTKMEIQKGILIPGHRCIPFTDSDVPSGLTEFFFDGERLPHKTITLSLQEAHSFFSLYGEEYAIQYILGDPANSSLEIRYDREFPSNVNLTVTDFSKVYEKCNFGANDIFLASVLDWDNSVVGIQPLISDKNNPFNQNPLDKKREKWYEELEKALYKSFEMYGPCSSIDEQITRAYFLNLENLCVSSCGTLEQFIHDTKKIGFESYGVETRLWYKGKEVPAIGTWLNNSTENKFTYKAEVDNSENYPVFDYILDSYIMNQCFLKKDDEEEILEKIFPENYIVNEKELKTIRNRLLARKNLLKKNYNWFSDFEIANIRQKVLELYRSIISLVYEIDTANINLNDLPQQSLVILTQLLSHTRFILESLLSYDEISSVDISNYEGSLEGMKYSLDEISIDLRDSLSKLIKTKFFMLKN